MISLSLSLAAMLLAAPAQAKSDSATMQEEAVSIEKAADSAAGAADAANKAASAAEKAATAAASAAESAAKAAEAAAKAVEQVQKSTAAAAAAAPATPAAPAAAPTTQTPSVVYTSVINLGLIALTGNAQSLSFTLGGSFQRKSQSWILSARGSAAYGQARTPGTEDTNVNAEAATAQLRVDRRFTEAATVYVLGGIDTDHIQSIEERPYGELGASLTWFDTKQGDLDKASLRTDLGFRYGREYRFQYFPVPLSLGAVDIVAPHAGLAFRYAVSKEIIFTEALDLVANLQGDPRLLLTNTAKIAARLSSSFSLTVSFLVNYDSLPPPPKLSTDTALTVGVEVAL